VKRGGWRGFRKSPKDDCYIDRGRQSIIQKRMLKSRGGGGEVSPTIPLKNSLFAFPPDRGGPGEKGLGINTPWAWVSKPHSTVNLR